MRWALVAIGLVAAAGRGHAGTSIRCDDTATADLAIDGLLDDWSRARPVATATAGPASIALRCAWDGSALALALDITDERVVRVKSGKGHEDHVDVSIAATGEKPIAIAVYPGTAIAKAKIVAPAHVEAADSLQPHGFSIEVRVPAARIPRLSAATPSLALAIVFHDSDAATGGADRELALAATIELGDRKDLLDDFLRTVKLRRSDLTLDTLAALDPDRRDKQRLVAGGTVIGVLADRFAFVTLPVQQAADVKQIALVPLGPHGVQLVSALIRQRGNGGSRDLLVLWTVWSGQLQPLAQIEVRKELGGNVLESTWRVARGKRGPELVVEPKPAVGWTVDTWHEEPATDADPIVLPWDASRGGVGYTLRGAELERRELPARRKPRR